MSFDNLMQSFASQNDLGELDFRDNKYYLMLDNAIDVACFQANGNCYIHGMLAPLPVDKAGQEDLLIRLLKRNLSLLYNQQVSLCIEPDGKELALYLVRSLQGFDEVELEKALVEYVTSFEFLKEEIDQQGPLPGSAPMMFMP